MAKNLRNPQLFDILGQLYGRVRVQNPGQPFRYKSVSLGGGQFEVVKVSSGEEYTACCPHCGDTRYRLNTNHVFGTRIEGQVMRHLAHCWNEECPVTDELYNAVILGGGTSLVLDSQATNAPISVETMARESHESFRHLKDLTRLDVMSEDHPAVQYVRGRGLDPVVLGSRYQVCYCNDADPAVRLARGRIVFPLFFNALDARGNPERVVVGWQSRAVPGLSHSDKPKYWTSPGCMRSHFLYLHDWARALGRGLVVHEGPTDALTTGEPACATLGRRITASQRALIVQTWGPGRSTYPVVLVGDPGFEADWTKNYLELQEEFGSESGRIILMAPEADANDLGRTEIRKRIAHECERRRLPSAL